jgi:heat shock protein HslJ
MKIAILRSRMRAALFVAACTWLGGCHRASPPVAPSTAAALELPFRAIGQEPGWVLELDEHQVRFEGNYGGLGVPAPVAEIVHNTESGVDTYTIDAGELAVVIRKTPCTDVMSGEQFTHTVTVRFDGRELQGCGRVRPPAEVRNIYWKLTELGDTPIAEVTEPREPHLRLATEESRATGSTGCNSFSGPYQLDGDRLRLGPLAMTRMACLDEALNRQEQDYVRALEATDRFAISNGQLVLYEDRRAVARFAAERLR